MRRISANRTPLTAPVTGVDIVITDAARTASRRTLDESPKRLFTFLYAIQARADIRETLLRIGLGEAEVGCAWAMLQTVIWGRHAPVAKPKKNTVAMAGLAVCELFIANAIPQARAKLALQYPDQAAFLLDSLSQHAKGVEAALMVGLFVERCAELETGADRTATRKKDHAALAALAQAGMDKKRFAEMARSSKEAQTFDVPEPAPVRPTPAEEDAQIANLRRIYSWLSEWSDAARTVIKRRDQLITMGLASRRSRKQKPAPAPTALPRPSAPPIMGPQAANRVA